MVFKNQLLPIPFDWTLQASLVSQRKEKPLKNSVALSYKCSMIPKLLLLSNADNCLKNDSRVVYQNIEFMRFAAEVDNCRS